MVTIAAVLEHVKLIVAAASTRGKTVLDFWFVDRGYTALEAESALYLLVARLNIVNNQCATLRCSATHTTLIPKGPVIVSVQEPQCHASNTSSY